MGLTIRCEGTGHNFDIGYGGFSRLRDKVSELYGGEWHDHYDTLNLGLRIIDIKELKKFYDAFDAKTAELVKAKKVPVMVADFLLQPDSDGKIAPRTCGQLLKIIGDYDDNILYGYVGRDCAMFRDFKKLLEECVATKSYLVWC